MKRIITLLVLLATLAQYSSVRADDPPIYAQTIVQACIRPMPTLQVNCSYNIPAGELSVLLPGSSSYFYRIRYEFAPGQFVIGWIWRTRVVLIYPGEQYGNPQKNNR